MILLTAIQAMIMNLFDPTVHYKEQNILIV